jgi:hypothetical protein
MRKSRSSGTVGERGGNDPLYPDIDLRLSINSGYRWSRASVFPLCCQNIFIGFLYYIIYIYCIVNIGSRI